MTGTTVVIKDSVAMFQRTSSVAAATKAPAAAAIHPFFRVLTFFRRAMETITPTIKSPAPIPERIQR